MNEKLKSDRKSEKNAVLCRATANKSVKKIAITRGAIMSGIRNVISAAEVPQAKVEVAVVVDTAKPLRVFFVSLNQSPTALKLFFFSL